MTNTFIEVLPMVQKAPSNEILGLPESLASILIPAIVSIIIFVFGIIIGWIKKKSEKKNEIKSYKKIILNWIGHLKTVVDLQFAACTDFSTRISNSQEIHSEKLSYNKLMVEKIEQIPLEKYIDTFVINSTGKPNENYDMTFKLIGHLKFLRDIEEQIPSIYKAYQEQMVDIMHEWNLKFQELHTLISTQVKLHAGKENRFNDQVLRIIKSWHNEAPVEGSNIIHSMTKLIMPLKKLIAEELNQNEPNEYAFDLLGFMEELSITHKKWRKLNTEYSTTFSQIANNIQASYANLQESKAHFENNTSVKNVFLLS